MKPILPALIPATTSSPASSASPAQGGTLNELIGAVPIVIFYRAVRELLRQRRHRRLVLEAFRR